MLLTIEPDKKMALSFLNEKDTQQKVPLDFWFPRKKECNISVGIRTQSDWGVSVFYLGRALLENAYFDTYIGQLFETAELILLKDKNS
jgi:hypothetical protein